MSEYVRVCQSMSALRFASRACQSETPGDDLSIGLHLDVNGGFPHCACSVILYLNEAGSCSAGLIKSEKQ